MNDTSVFAKKARTIFESGGYSLVLCGGEKVYIDTANGIKPIMKLIARGVDLEGFCAADKIVGKAAAMLFSLVKIKEVYAAVMSRAALEYLRENGISAEYETLVDRIENRTGTGACPMEQAVADIDDAAQAYEALKQKCAEMKIQL